MARFGRSFPLNGVWLSKPPVAAAAIAYTLTVTAGAVTATGSAVGLTLERTLSVQAGSATASGSSVGLTLGRSVTVNAGAVTGTGSSVDLTFTHIGVYVLTVNSGAIVFSGSSVTLTFTGINTIADMPHPALRSTAYSPLRSPLAPRRGFI